MRNTDQQLKNILERSENIKRQHENNRKTALYSIGIGMCMVVMAMAVVFAPSVIERAVQTEDMRYGSLILSAGHMAYVIIALLAFILGILITLLCFHLNEIKKMKDTEQ